MKYLIVGCGRVGSTLAKRLAAANHSVTVIDENSIAFRRLGRDFPGQLVLGTGIDVDVLARAGAKGADGFAATTQGDNRNIMAALIAQEHFKIKRVVARIYDPERSIMYRGFGVSTICPTTVGARLIANALEEQPFRKMPFERQDIDVVEYTVRGPLVGKTVNEMTVTGKTQTCVVVRREASLVPTQDLKLEDGDKVVAVVSPEYLDTFRRSLGADAVRSG